METLNKVQLEGDSVWIKGVEAKPKYTQSDTLFWLHQKETKEGITNSNCDQGSSEGPQMHPRVGMKS